MRSYYNYLLSTFVQLFIFVQNLSKVLYVGTQEQCVASKASSWELR